jgi:EAL domain-containing protein (putative c-di-GMP-specific phosphodiesterase class I)
MNMALSGDIQQRYRTRDLIEALLDDPRQLGPDYQPIYSIPDGALVGVKATGRGAPGTELTDTFSLLDGARPLGLVERLDWAFRALALSDGLQRPELELHLTPEPETLGRPGPPKYAALMGRANRGLRVAAELHAEAFATEVALEAGARELRSWGWRLVLADVADDLEAIGRAADLRPDVIQIDLRQAGRQPGDQHHGVQALLALAAECDAAIMALGVDNLSARDAALALGASLARGDVYGGPGPWESL